MTIRFMALLAIVPLGLAFGSPANAGDEPTAKMSFGDWSIFDDGVTGQLEVTWTWPDGQLAGFQFDLTGVRITGVSGGLAADYDFTIAHSETTAIGFFSTPQGWIPSIERPRVLVVVDFTLSGEDDTIRMEDVVCADPLAESIPVSHDAEIDPYAESCCGDINGDGMVDGSDLTILLGNWGEPGAGDFDGDGVTDGADLTVLLGCWGPCP